MLGNLSSSRDLVVGLVLLDALRMTDDGGVMVQYFVLNSFRFIRMCGSVAVESKRL